MEMQEAVQEQTQLRSGVLQHEGTIAELRAENGRLDEEVRALREDGRERSASKPDIISKVLELARAADSGVPRVSYARGVTLCVTRRGERGRRLS